MSLRLKLEDPGDIRTEQEGNALISEETKGLRLSGLHSEAAPDRLSLIISTVQFAEIGVISLYADRVAHLTRSRSEILR